nr:hypothetical protein [Candidatus Njordarchaeota archaeon]
MLQEFWEFDRKLIHEKYQKVGEKFETKKQSTISRNQERKRGEASPDSDPLEREQDRN